HTIIGHVRDNPDSLQKLLDLFNKAGENTHVSEVIELLAHASVQAGDLPRARDLYQKLATVEPQNPLHMQNYQQVVGQIGGTSGGKLITPEEAVVLIDDLEATAPSVHQHYTDEISLAVRSALTDAELFISYNMPAKALGPLVGVLPLAPTDLRINQRLAALHTRAGRFAEAAICCRTLQTLYSDAEAAPVVQAWPTAAEPEFAVVNESAAASDEAAAGTAEIDLSSEWDDSLTVETDAPAVEAAEVEVEVASATGDPKADEATEEIRFYLAHSMPEQAMAALAKLQALNGDQAKIAELRAEVEAATQHAEEAAVAAEPVVEELTADDIPTIEVEVDETRVEEAPAPVVNPAIVEPAGVEVEAAVVEPAVVEPEPPAVEEIPVIADRKSVV